MGDEDRIINDWGNLSYIFYAISIFTRYDLISKALKLWPHFYVRDVISYNYMLRHITSNDIHAF